MKKHLIYTLISLILLPGLCGCTQTLKPTDLPTTLPTKDEGGYLWIFMTNANYFKMFYAVSRNCYDWMSLNLGRPVDDDFKGHPTLTNGRDGAWYQIGVEKENTEGLLTLYRTEDFIEWTKTDFPASALSKDGWTTDHPAHGAPKPYYDEASDQYIICWHMGTPYTDSKTRRTMYSLTKDFVTFTEPQTLFSFTDAYADIATIDTFIKKIGSKYYAITKIESSQDDYPEVGKTICYCTSDNLTGPYSNPTRITSAGLPREAPILVDAPDGKLYLYTENYYSSPYGYDLLISDRIEGQWMEHTFMGPNVSDGTTRPGARHGWIVPVNEAVYQGLIGKYYLERSEATANLNLSGILNTTQWPSNDHITRYIEIQDGSQLINNTNPETTVISEDKKSASFSYETSKRTVSANNYDYYFITPVSAINDVSANAFTLTFPGRQTPNATSPDPSASVYTAQSLGNKVASYDFNSTLKPLNAYMKISFENFALKNVQAVTVTIDGKNLSGKMEYKTGSFSNPKALVAYDNISADLSNVTVSENFDLYLATVPFSLKTGDEINFSLASGKLSYIFKHTVTEPVEFTYGNMQNLIVDASSAVLEDITVNGILMKAKETSDDRYYAKEGYITTDKMSLKQGQTVIIKGITDIDNLVPKEWLEPTVVSGTYKFRAVDGDYVMFFNPKTSFIAFEVDNRAALYPTNLWHNGKVDCNAHARYIYLNRSFPCFPDNLVFRDKNNVKDPAYYICMAKTSEYDKDSDGKIDSYVFEDNFYCFAKSNWICRFRIQFNTTNTQLDLKGYTLYCDDNEAEFSDAKNPAQASNPSLRRGSKNWETAGQKEYNLVLDTGAKTITLKRIN